MPPAGFEPAIPAGDRPQTHALDRSATGIGLTRTSAYFNAHKLLLNRPKNAENKCVCRTNKHLKEDKFTNHSNRACQAVNSLNLTINLARNLNMYNYSPFSIALYTTSLLKRSRRKCVTQIMTKRSRLCSTYFIV